MTLALPFAVVYSRSLSAVSDGINMTLRALSGPRIAASTASALV
jgi:hypothetical protein